MNNGDANVDTYIAVVLPFAVRVAAGNGRIQYICRASKDLLVGWTEGIVLHSNRLKRCSWRFTGWEVIVLVDHQFVGKTPECLSYDSRPAGHCMKQHYAGITSEDTNVAFSKTICQWAPMPVNDWLCSWSRISCRNSLAPKNSYVHKIIVAALSTATSSPSVLLCTFILCFLAINCIAPFPSTITAPV
jgi:hypothetical protein